MPRPIFDESKVHEAIRDNINAKHIDIIEEVQNAIDGNDVVVVGMAINPVPRKACAFLKEQGIPHKNLSYGSYFSQWRRRTALKQWTGWHTFPMIFIKGIFIGGFDDLLKLHKSGELPTLLGK